jgi:hypothetical protein
MYWFMGRSDCAKCGRCGSAAAGTLPAQACGNDYDEDGHGSHVAGVPVATRLLDIGARRSYSTFTFSFPGTIAGSTNLAADSSPSAFRNNGVAGASTMGATARGAQLFFQVPLDCILSCTWPV